MTPGGSIQVTYQDLTDASSKFAGQLSTLLNLLNEIQGTINSVAGASWVSGAQAQFSEDIASWNTSATRIQQAGTQLAGFLQTAAQSYQQTDQGLQQALQKNG